MIDIKCMLLLLDLQGIFQAPGFGQVVFLQQRVGDLAGGAAENRLRGSLVVGQCAVQLVRHLGQTFHQQRVEGTALAV